MRFPSFTTVRIFLLLGFLVIVGFTSAHQLVYTRNWNQTLEVTLYPINADGNLSTAKYINSLDTASFAKIDRWSIRESKRHNLMLKKPISVSLGAQIEQLPPSWPENDNTVAVLWWGLRFRWWAFQNTPKADSGLTKVRLFVMYYEGEEDTALSHSLGMQKGLLGLVHAFALKEQTAQNNIVIAHEVLHTVGAIDKYNSHGGPLYPVGYANPRRQPLFPQRSAEIMSGRIPTSYGSSYMAESLKSVLISSYTAKEINWIQ